jgi:UDP-N-acetylmuramoylalanine--D-glutamate ligase
MGASTPRPPLPGGPYLVVGLARSGQAAARLLAGRGEQVAGVDSGSPGGAEGLTGLGVEVSLDDDGLGHLDGVRCLVKSPGVPAAAPVVAAARERNIAVVGELELAWRLLPNRFVAVTGTNGKTTVAELLGEIWRGAGEEVAVAGNVGTPLASLVGAAPPDATVVCETSSFQLEDTEAFAPECALLLNISPDHLDRHGTLDAYLDAKLRAFANQGNDGFAIYDGCEPAFRDRDLGGCARRIAFCGDCDGPDCEVVLDGDVMVAAGEPLISVGELGLIGPHNTANAMAAAAAALAMGIDAGDVAAGLRSFRGVPHRLERLGEVGGVAYVNDSKATNVAAARAAISSFDAPVHVILGGSSKGERFTDLAGALSANARAAYLIGETAGELDSDLAVAWAAGVERHRSGDLPAAVREAAAAAHAGEVVLLAPACASFDAYPDFTARGEHFRALVEDLR